jgi:hypothetical protein
MKSCRAEPSSSPPLLTLFFLSLKFYCEDGDIMFITNIVWLSSNYTFLSLKAEYIRSKNFSIFQRRPVISKHPFIGTGSTDPVTLWASEEPMTLRQEQIHLPKHWILFLNISLYRELRRIVILCSNRPWRSIGLWDVKDPTISSQWANRRWGCAPYAPTAFYSPTKIPGIHLC